MADGSDGSVAVMAKNFDQRQRDRHERKQREAEHIPGKATAFSPGFASVGFDPAGAKAEPVEVNFFIDSSKAKEEFAKAASDMNAFAEQATKAGKGWEETIKSMAREAGVTRAEFIKQLADQAKAPKEQETKKVDSPF
jgi:hypothetical protein